MKKIIPLGKLFGASRRPFYEKSEYGYELYSPNLVGDTCGGTYHKSNHPRFAYAKDLVTIREFKKEMKKQGFW